MKKWMEGRRIGLLACVLITAFLLQPCFSVAAGNTTQGSSVEKEVHSSSRRQAWKKRETIIREAVAALDQTRKAIEAIKKKDRQAALDALAMAAGKLDIVLARDPALATAPIDVQVETLDLYASVNTIKQAVKKAEDHLESGQVQQARHILGSLASEIDIVVTSIPLKSYSAAIKRVARLVDQEKYQPAMETLYEALSTLVITRNIIPLPILRAEELLKKAEKLAQHQGRSEKQNHQLDRLLTDAGRQLKIAEVLGYGDKDQYKGFYDQIEKIRDKTSGGKFGKGFFDGLKKSLHKFKDKIFNASENK